MSLAAFQRREELAALEAAGAADEERRLQEAIAKEERERKQGARRHFCDRCCKVKGCTRLVFLLIMLVAFLFSILFYESKRGFGKLLALPVGAVFFVAITAAILEEIDTPTCSPATQPGAKRTKRAM